VKLVVRLRASEWVLLAYFCYAALLPAILPGRANPGWQPIWILISAGLLLWLVARAENYWPVAISRFRDFLPLALTLAAFEEMELFVAQRFDPRLEDAWIKSDKIVLHDWHLRSAVESLGWLIPLYLELCYLLVYGLGTYCVIILYLRHRRQAVDRFFVILLTGTLLAYALLPYFPSQPPRLLFPDLYDPNVTTWVRRFNLWILSKATIHVGVFPSAHVSSAFAAAWAMFVLIPERKRFGWGVLFYAISVSIATIYGRYHYTADVLAGFGVSLIAGAVALAYARRKGTLR
jgi:membrane-associated phospholipid phosphatase